MSEKNTDALDALLHAVAPIPLHKVTKLIHDSNQELISEFRNDFVLLPESVDCIIDLVYSILKEFRELCLSRAQREAIDNLKEYKKKYRKWEKK